MTDRARGRRWGQGRRSAGRIAVLAAVGLGGFATTLGLSVGGPVLTASGAPVADCTTTTGVVVAVDFQPFGGQIQVGCDPTTTTGLDALQVAGFTPTGTSQFGDAFICLIDGFPRNQSCASTPPASASWSFWLADAGANAWTYSPGGAATLQPRPGSVEAWTFGSSNPDNRPGFAPSTVRATTPGPTPPATTTTTTAPVAASGPPTATGGGGPPVSTSPATGASSGSPGGPVTHIGGESGAATGPAVTTTTRPGTTTKTSGDPAGASATGSATHGSTSHGSTSGGSAPQRSTAPVVVAAAPAATDTHGSSGSPLPIVVTALAVIVLGGAAALVARRRRRSA